MAISITVILESATVGGILLLLAEKYYCLRRNKKTIKENGDDVEYMKTKLDEIGQTANNTSADMGIVKNEISHFRTRCDDHLKNQSEMNKSVSDMVLKLNDRIFEIVKKD